MTGKKETYLVGGEMTALVHCSVQATSAEAAKRSARDAMWWYDDEQPKSSGMKITSIQREGEDEG